MGQGDQILPLLAPSPLLDSLSVTLLSCARSQEATGISIAMPQPRCYLPPVTPTKPSADPWSRGVYLVPDAARILRLPVAVLRSWVAGTMERGPGADGRQEGTGGNLTERKAWKGFQRKFLSFRRFWTQQGATHSR